MDHSDGLPLTAILKTMPIKKSNKKNKKYHSDGLPLTTILETMPIKNKKIKK